MHMVDSLYKPGDMNSLLNISINFFWYNIGQLYSVIRQNSKIVLILHRVQEIMKTTLSNLISKNIWSQRIHWRLLEVVRQQLSKFEQLEAKTMATKIGQIFPIQHFCSRTLVHIKLRRNWMHKMKPFTPRSMLELILNMGNICIWKAYKRAVSDFIVSMATNSIRRNV